jgi:hypothetical protein
MDVSENADVELLWMALGLGRVSVLFRRFTRSDNPALLQGLS